MRLGLANGPFPNRRDTVRLGLFIPTSGPAGIWGPSCRSGAELAAEEINGLGGIRGCEVKLHIADAGDDPEAVADHALELVDEERIDALVGMHTSDVREALAHRLGTRIPYVYTPLYEGGEGLKSALCIGETPRLQLLPALAWLESRYGFRRWALIGNDYVWPRQSHRVARAHFLESGAKVLCERYLSFGTQDFDDVLDLLDVLAPDAVLLSLVGGDAVRFNREFGRAGLDRKMARLSCAVEENMLLAIGAGNTERLFAVSGYFGVLRTPGNDSFLERYHQRFGDSAPVMNAIGESVYEGVHFLAAAANKEQALATVPRRDIRIPGPKNALWRAADRTSRFPMYLAEAQGHQFALRANVSLTPG